MLLALHTLSGALRMLSPVPPEEEEAAQETEAEKAEAAPERAEAERSRGIIDWADDESDTVSIRLAHWIIISRLIGCFLLNAFDWSFLLMYRLAF
jgi:hypothetical protein